VLSGTARAVVVSTGARTYFGGIAEKLGRQRVLTSFDKGINSFTWLMIRFMIVMVAAVFLIIGFTKRDSAHPWVDALLFGLAVAVGLTPEMLPMIVTVNLSKGAIAMARKKAIVKRLNSIQNFGAMDVLCTDKTGTLTQDRIVLERHVDVTNRESEDVLRYAYLNSYYQTGLRSLLDKTILAHEDIDVGRSCGKVDEIPFDFQRRRMSVVIDYEGDHVLVCKGAVEEVVRASSRYQVDEEVHPLIDMLRNDILEEYQSLSAQGYRVLAVAYREFPTTQRVFSIADESDLILLGYIAFFDPPKDSAGKALEALSRSGVATKILTGDNELVSRKVCQDVGLKIDGIVTGDKLKGLSDDEFAKLVEKTTVFARLSPAQKEQIIHALQRAGHVVGFMGDGINDAPAMKAADVSISVDTAVDVAKESADIILLEKNLMVLEDGILEGRRVFGNIIKYIKMGASSNFGNMFSMVGGSFFLPFLPMAPIQVLVNNLLYDFSQVGIPTDRVDDEYLEKPRRWNIASIKRFMIFLGPVSSIFDYTTFFLMLLVFHCWNYSKLPSDAALLATQVLQLTGAGTPYGFPIGMVGAAVKSYYENLFHTGWFVESILTQTLIVHVIRTNRIPFLQSRASLALSLTTLLVMGAAIALPYSPLAGYLSLEPLPLSYWGYIAATLVAYVGLAHLMKTWFIKKYGAD
jgi:Mg2+-importing ATPase